MCNCAWNRTSIVDKRAQLSRGLLVERLLVDFPECRQRLPTCVGGQSLDFWKALCLNLNSYHLIRFWWLQLWLNLIFKICKIWYGPVCAVISRYSFPGSCVGTIFDIYALFDDIHRAFYNSFVCFVCAYMIIIKPVHRIIIKPVHRIIMKPVHMIIIKPVHVWLSSNLCIGVGAHDQTLCITCGHCNP